MTLLNSCEQRELLLRQEEARKLWQCYLETGKKQGRERLRIQAKSLAVHFSAMAPPLMAMQMFQNYYFGQILYVKILLKEFHALCSPSSAQPSSTMSEKDCREQLKLSLTTLHKMVHSCGMLSNYHRVSLHAVWLYAHITLHATFTPSSKLKQLSAEHGQAIQEMSTILKSLISSSNGEEGSPSIKLIKPIEEMVEPNPSPEDVSYEGFVAMNEHDEKRILRGLYSMVLEVRGHEGSGACELLNWDSDQLALVPWAAG